MNPVMACMKCDLAFPQFPKAKEALPYFTCPDCGGPLKFVRPISRKEAKRMRLNMEAQLNPARAFTIPSINADSESKKGET
jgi:transcription initiation factor IIE alpha subunit